MKNQHYIKENMMLGRFNHVNTAQQCAEINNVQVSNRYSRNELDDIKKAIELLYEFDKKINELHPIAREVIAQLMLVHPNRY
jgi:hypothetical protein